MSYYGKMKGPTEQPFPEMRAHASVHNSLVMVADPKNANAVVYAAAFNQNLSAVEAGEEPQQMPPANFDLSSIKLELRDEKGIAHHFKGLDKAADDLRADIKNGKNIPAQMKRDYNQAMDAYHQAMDTAPSDYFVSHLQGKEYRVRTNEGIVVVNKDNPDAVKWAKEVEKAVRPDGSVDLEKIPKMDFAKGDAEFQPLPGASAAQVKEYNALNTMHQRGIPELAREHRASLSAATHAPAKPATFAMRP